MAAFYFGLLTYRPPILYYPSLPRILLLILSYKFTLIAGFAVWPKNVKVKHSLVLDFRSGRWQYFEAARILSKIKDLIYRTFSKPHHFHKRCNRFSTYVGQFHTYFHQVWYRLVGRPHVDNLLTFIQILQRLGPGCWVYLARL